MQEQRRGDLGQVLGGDEPLAERDRVEAERAQVAAARAALLARPPGARLVLADPAGRAPAWIEVAVDGYRIVGAGDALHPRERFLADNGPMLAVAARIADAAAAVQVLIRTQDAAALRARLVRVEREREQARAERDAAAAAQVAAEAAATAARRSLAADKEALEQVRRERSPEVVARGPGRQRPAGSRPVYVECLDAPDGSPRIRPVTPAFFTKVPEGWRAVAAAQPLATLADGSAPWASLRPPADGEPARHLYAVVRPGGFAAYRTLGRWAAERGWWLDWDPLPAGEIIPVGAAATSAAAP